MGALVVAQLPARATRRLWLGVGSSADASEQIVAEANQARRALRSQAKRASELLYWKPFEHLRERAR
jgi:hypothetical protein